ncbi:MAG TPA: SGNH/GDSL hydrolase family protein [Bryobacteraceae bacterium]|nr:SGNH/GDSL hydrolase family protein [Bryobacteraceae bacterium]
MVRKQVYFLRALSLLVSVALVAILGEIVLRIASYKHGRVSLAAFTQYDPLLGWRIAPNTHTRVFERDYSTTLEYGPKGLRGKDRPYAKPAGVFRILVLGDSMVDGFSVPLEDRVSEVLEARLGPGTDVVNLGVPGYSTDQEMLMLESEGWKYQPDLVVLFFFYNDIWMNGERRIGRATFKPVFKLDEAGNPVLMNVPVPKPVQALEDRSKLYALIRDAVKARPSLYRLTTFGHGWTRSTLPMPSGAGGSADQFRVYQKEDKPELRRVWAITQALLRRMNRETREHGARFLLFYVPSPVELSAEEWSKSNIPASYGPDVVVGRVAQICRSEGIALLEPSQRFREARKNGPLSYAHDIHWTKAGHRLAADLVAEYVQNAMGGRIEPQVRAQNSPVGR